MEVNLNNLKTRTWAQNCNRKSTLTQTKKPLMSVGALLKYQLLPCIINNLSKHLKDRPNHTLKILQTETNPLEW